MARSGVSSGSEAAERAHGWMRAHQPLLAALAVSLLVVFVAIGGWQGSRRRVAADDRAELARAERVLDSIATLAWADERRPAARRTLDSSGVLALSYVARARLGTSSPFRLAAFAQRDARLPAPLGRTVAWAMVARAARGGIAQTDTAALAGAPAASRQLAIIDSVVARAEDARTGETAVRIGYALAGTEGVITSGNVVIATRLAAIARDRRLAREDAERLLRASAGAHDRDALETLAQWRSERRLLVEQPLLADAMRANDAAAVRGGLALRDVLRAALRQEAERVATRVDGRTDAASVAASVAAPVAAPAGGMRAAPAFADLPSSAARRLAELASVRGGPPQAPVAVGAAGYRRQLARGGSAGGSAGGGADAVTRWRFADRARSEESMVAELAIASHGVSGIPADVAGVALTATVALRTFAQDSVPPTAVAAPTVESLVTRFGVRAVTFDRTTPPSWRRYQLAQIAGALSDVQAVLPGVTFDGLAIHVGESVKRDSALALHDPASRTLYLPAATGAGTIAHELAHDLDWQTARTQLAVRGTYSTDRAAKVGQGALASSVRGLTAARPRSSSVADRTTERPAELFARSVDWFVALSLARQGRMNGALSAVQDEVIGGYAGARVPEAGDGAADALLALLSDMTVVPSRMGDAFIDRYGARGAPTIPALLHVSTARSSVGERDRALRAFGLVDAGCVRTATGPVTAGNWRAVLIRALAESRARELLQLRGRRWSAPSRWSWEARATLGGPWSPAVADSAIARTRDALLRAARWDDLARHPLGDGKVGVTAATALAMCPHAE